MKRNLINIATLGSLTLAMHDVKCCKMGPCLMVSPADGLVPNDISNKLETMINSLNVGQVEVTMRSKADIYDLSMAIRSHFQLEDKDLVTSFVSQSMIPEELLVPLSDNELSDVIAVLEVPGLQDKKEIVDFVAGYFASPVFVRDGAMRGHWSVHWNYVGRFV